MKSHVFWCVCVGFVWLVLYVGIVMVGQSDLCLLYQCQTCLVTVLLIGFFIKPIHSIYKCSLPASLNCRNISVL